MALSDSKKAALLGAWVLTSCGNWVPLDDRIGVRAEELLAIEEQRQGLRDRQELPPPRLREERDSQGRLRRSWSEIVLPGEPNRKHGFERAWGGNGQLTTEREWDLGHPAGLWRAWYPDGALRSRFVCAGPNAEATPMEFWHANGQIAAVGPGRDGVRDGEWQHFDASGQLRKQGTYQRGTKHGVWSYWLADGSLEARGRYAAGVRVGEWERPGAVVQEPRTP